tara:strand:+ start:3047 stop:3364 length:318 start_codon:yes stop_codon:yes gene_type:complete
MINLIMGLSLMQWVFIGAGLLMMSPSVRNLLLGVVNRIRVIPKIRDSADSNSLTSIVAKWEALNNACIDAGLVDAQDRLQEVFLALAKKSADPKGAPVAPDKGDG